ncbi:MAG TPA: hypothetical protein VMH84_15850 [Xanthobacteraceae bacterium]|nr:hypothetical protein [Xanthobacteraceae bacterium]
MRRGAGAGRFFAVRAVLAGAVPLAASWCDRTATRSSSSWICSSALKVEFARGGGMS